MIILNKVKEIVTLLLMPKKEIIFLNNVYKTQGEFENFVKNFIYNEIGLCDDIKNKYPEKYKIIIELLKRHPDFNNKTQNMYNIKIVTDTLNKSAYKIMIINNDNTEIDISWRCAITGKHKNNKHELVSAMRSSIDDQILKFKKENKNICELCNNKNNLHVDHILHFDELVFNFIKITKNTIPYNFNDTNDNTHRRCFLNEDIEFKIEWIDYHKKNATLRILCQNCNLSRKKSKCKI
jgi:hypothetical protein